MLKPLSGLRSRAGRFRQGLRNRLDRAKVKRLYSPDPHDLDLQRHCNEAIEWLKRAQDAGTDRGVSFGLAIGADFRPSYPETTGYICRTFVELAQERDDEHLLQRAVEMGEWEADVQMDCGAVMSGAFNQNPKPAIFNTGMVLLGWSALIQAGVGKRSRAAATRAADWMVEMQEPDGNWKKGNSNLINPTSTLYNVKAAWGLAEAGVALEREDYVKAAVRNAEFCIARQLNNGWFSDCCLDDPARPLLHTIAYTMEGLLGIGRIAARSEFTEAARKTADAELRIMQPDGFLPGRQDSEFLAAADWCCLTGSAQTSVVWSKLFEIGKDKKYLDAVARVNRYLMARHDIRTKDLRLRGGVPGSWPIWGGYQPFGIVNWAVKFLVDALRLQITQEKLSTQPASLRSSCGEAS